jgi:hypothetical protein
MDHCANSPCVSGALCVSGVDTFSCQCTDKRFQKVDSTKCPAEETEDTCTGIKQVLKGKLGQVGHMYRFKLLQMYGEADV